MSNFCYLYLVYYVIEIKVLQPCRTVNNFIIYPHTYIHLVSCHVCIDHTAGLVDFVTIGSIYNVIPMRKQCTYRHKRVKMTIESLKIYTNIFNTNSYIFCDIFRKYL